MFVYLSKKIAIPSDSILNIVAWDYQSGYLVCGGTKGYHKILKFESQRDNDSTSNRGISAAFNITLNQTLSSHSESVVKIKWNPGQSKFASADTTGTVVIWVLYQGKWCEEMVNNRQKSPVSDFQWSPDGEKIIIAYEDGSIIMGSVEGRRLWGKELKDKIKCLEWSPDSKLLLMASESGHLQIYDSSGNYMTRINEMGDVKFEAEDKIDKICWYSGKNGYVEQNCPCLALKFQNSGKIVIAYSEKQVSDPIVVSTRLQVTELAWNPNGTVLAVVGSLKEDSNSIVVSLYDNYGQHLRTTKTPGKQINCVSWEPSGIRLALAVDSFIYIANCRPSYQWAYMTGLDVDTGSISDGTVAYMKPTKVDPSILFWNLRTGELYQKQVYRLLCISSFEDQCLLVTKNYPRADEGPEVQLIICDALGSTIKSKIISFTPKSACLTKTSAILVNRDGYHIHVWHFADSSDDSFIGVEEQQSKLLKAANEFTKDICFHVDTLRVGSIVAASGEMLKNHKNSGIHVSTVGASGSRMLIGRTDGVMHEVSIRDLFHIADHLHFKDQPPAQSISINCDGTKCAVIDLTGVTRIFAFPQKTSDEAAGETYILLSFERKDTWALMWARDHPDRFAVMEKTRIYIYKDFVPEEPVESSGYICDFENLQLKLIYLDDLLTSVDDVNKKEANSSGPSKANLVDSLDTKTLRDTKNILKTVGLADAFKFVSDNSHPTLWNLLGNEAIRRQDFPLALKSFVNCKDYASIQFIKRIQIIEDKRKKDAEIYAWFVDFEKADKLYEEVGRGDLAMDMWITAGDYVKALSRCGQFGNVKVREMLESEMCAYFAERMDYANAIQHKTLTRDYVKACFMNDNYDRIRQAAAETMDSSMLEWIGNLFRASGLCKDACDAFVKAGKHQQAVETCIFLRAWEHARNFPSSQMVDSYFNEFAKNLESDGQVTALAQLYWEANMYEKCSQLLLDVSELMWARQKPIIAQQLLVMAALAQSRVLGESDCTLWESVRSVHWYLLAQKFYNQEDYASALRCAHESCRPRKTSRPNIPTLEQKSSFLTLVSIKCNNKGGIIKAVQMNSGYTLKTAADLWLKRDDDHIDWFKYLTVGTSDEDLVWSEEDLLCAETAVKIKSVSAASVCRVCKSKFAKQKSQSEICFVCHQETFSANHK